MMKASLKCIIVDDEPPAIRLLEKYISKVTALELVASTTNPLEALQILEKNSIDLAFLDIQMPNLTGIQLSKIIDANTKVIFTTAYPQFALESYELNAVDYLLKPFEFERFYKAISKAIPNQSIKNVKDNKGCLFVKTDGKNNYENINVSDILFVEGLKNYVAIHVKDRQIITYNTLKYIYENLPKDDFIQIHKSYIVAIRHIDKTNSISVQIGNKDLPIGNSYKVFFFDQIRKLKL